MSGVKSALLSQRQRPPESDLAIFSTKFKNDSLLCRPEVRKLNLTPKAKDFRLN
jgi:hypothetical protein